MAPGLEQVTRKLSHEQLALIVLRALLNAIFLLPFLAAQNPGREHVGQALRFCLSFDHLVGAGEQTIRHGKAERLGGLKPGDIPVEQPSRCTTRAQSCTLIGGAAPRRQWSSASRSAEERGFANVTYSILHSQDGTVAYVNRFQEPAFFGRNEADGAIRQYSARMGGVPKLGPGSFRPPVDYVALYPRPDEPLLSLKVL